MPHLFPNVRASVEIELIRSLFATWIPSAIMSVGFVMSAILICSSVDGIELVLLAIAGAVFSLLRMAFVLLYLREGQSMTLSLARARQLQQGFALTYFAFALALGAFGAVVLFDDNVHENMLITCLLVGYGAGVATGTGLRPLIAIPSMTAAILPAVMASLFHSEPIYWATGGMMAAFLVGGCHSVLNRYRLTRDEIGARFASADIARQDQLTALPNRLALREWFETHVIGSDEDRILAVHCLDLDGFKPVNDHFGHATGDELLRAVATRLAGHLRPSDIAARLGGDEFAVLQIGLAHEEEARLLAQRLARMIQAPFQVGDYAVQVSTSIGYVTSSEKAVSLDDLLSRADEALYLAKRSEGSIAGWQHKGVEPIRAMRVA